MFDTLQIDTHGDFFHQTRWWAELKSKFGWTIVSCRFHGKENLLYIRNFAKLFSIAYVPFPHVHADTPEQYCKKLAQFARETVTLLPKHCICLRIDTALFSSELLDSKQTLTLKQVFADSNLYKGQNVQPPDTVLLNLENSEDEILAAMKPKWRYNIRLAQKKGITIKESHGEDFEIFWKLYQETAQRDAIAIHQKTYYEAVFNSGNVSTNQKPRVKQWTAWYNDKPISAIITIYYGKRATYLYGASSNEHRNLMAPYLLQWSAMLDAKHNGCSLYDLYGIPPTEDPKHPMAGLYRFKTGFGGIIRHYAGCFDFPVHPIQYKLFTMAEQMRLWWYKSIKKKVKKIFSKKKQELKE